MKLFKFRTLQDCKDLKRIIDIVEKGFYCSDILNFNDMNEGIFKTIDFPDIGLTDKIKYKICSFSGINALKNELMWGHYANAGKGVVIEVNTCQDIENVIDDIYKVRYSNQVTSVNNSIHDDRIVNILTRKSLVWQYEDEFRYIKNTAEDRVKIGKISRIWFGTPYKNLENYHDFIEKNEKLQKYLSLKEILTRYCDSQDIRTEDFEFDFR